MQLLRLSQKLLQSQDKERLYWYCPSCDMLHPANLVKKDPTDHVWKWDGNKEQPTFSPSFLTSMGKRSSDGVQRVCHVFVRQGTIQYLSDSNVSFSSVTVQLPDIPADYVQDFVINQTTK